MAANWNFIRINVRRHADGLFMATSPDLAGVYVAHRDLTRILDDMPEIIKLWYRKTEKREVEVFQQPIKQMDDDFSIQAISVPAEVAAAALRR